MLIQCMDWNIATRQKGIPQSDLPDLHQKAVDLLDLLQKNLPDKTGEKGKWNFEKAHSILHKVREIVLWGNSDNTSCQAPEVCTCTYLFMIGMYWYTPSTYWYILVYSHGVLVLSARPYREYQHGGEPYQQQGCVHVHPSFPCSGWLPPDI